jgi:hypothetical protein
MPTLPIKHRAKRKDKSTEWVYGFYAEKAIMRKHFILQEEIQPYSRETILKEIEVLPETVGQLRHINKYGEYYDGDVYYHAGYGMETVSAICEIQFSLAHGTDDDICTIAGNIHDVPDIINKVNELPT